MEVKDLYGPPGLLTSRSDHRGLRITGSRRTSRLDEVDPVSLTPNSCGAYNRVSSNFESRLEVVESGVEPI